MGTLRTVVCGCRRWAGRIGDVPSSMLLRSHGCHERHNDSAITALHPSPAGLRSPGCHERHNDSAITALHPSPAGLRSPWVPRAAQRLRDRCAPPIAGRIAEPLGATGGTTAPRSLRSTHRRPDCGALGATSGTTLLNCCSARGQTCCTSLLYNSRRPQPASRRGARPVALPTALRHVPEDYVVGVVGLFAAPKFNLVGLARHSYGNRARAEEATSPALITALLLVVCSVA
jgi:hypothetical protein